MRRTYSRSRRAFKPADRSRRRPGRPAARSRTAIDVRPRARGPRSRRRPGPQPRPDDRAGKVEQPRRQEINTVGRLVDDLVEHVEHLAHQLICVLAQTRRGSRPAARAGSGRPRAPGAGIPRSRMALRRNRRSAFVGSRRGRRCKRSAERLHLVTRHVDQRVHPGAGHGRDAAQPADPAPGDEADAARSRPGRPSCARSRSSRRRSRARPRRSRSAAAPAPTLRPTRPSSGDDVASAADGTADGADPPSRRTYAASAAESCRSP